jgi:FkbM family methyltransferase
VGIDLLKRAASWLPLSFQQILKLAHYRRKIRRGEFELTISEYHMLASMVSLGDWVIDVGANIGQYSKRFSDLVGPGGRVIAIEPIPETFALLVSNSALFQYRNITLLNLAASQSAGLAGFQIPRFETGLKNFYRAAISDGHPDIRVLALPLDALEFPRRIGFIKVDAEGHDLLVLQGGKKLLERDHPVLLVEAADQEMAGYLADLGYQGEPLRGTVNTLFRYTARET